MEDNFAFCDIFLNSTCWYKGFCSFEYLIKEGWCQGNEMLSLIVLIGDVQKKYDKAGPILSASVKKKYPGMSEFSSEFAN